MTDPSHTLSDVQDEGDPAGSRTTTPEHVSAAESASASGDASAAEPVPVAVPVAVREPQPAQEPAPATETADTASSTFHGGGPASGETASGEPVSGEPASGDADATTTAPVPSGAVLGFPEGEPQSLHPAHLRTRLIGHWITICVLSFGAFTILSSVGLAGRLRGMRMVSVPGLVVTAIGLIAWWGWRYSHIEHRRTSFVISAAGCEIRRGVLWRQIITVPLSRIQHTDVTQGPLQRAYGLATLTLYTAGTEHAKVDLSGLAFETAMAIRQYLFERSESYDHSKHVIR